MWLLSVLAAACLLGGPRDVVFNEIMYRPPEHNYQDEYIELFNRGADDAVSYTHLTLPTTYSV